MKGAEGGSIVGSPEPAACVDATPGLVDGSLSHRVHALLVHRERRRHALQAREHAPLERLAVRARTLRGEVVGAHGEHREDPAKRDAVREEIDHEVPPRGVRVRRLSKVGRADVRVRAIVRGLTRRRAVRVRV